MTTRRKPKRGAVKRKGRGSKAIFVRSRKLPKDALLHASQKRGTLTESGERRVLSRLFKAMHGDVGAENYLIKRHGIEPNDLDLATEILGSLVRIIQMNTSAGWNALQVARDDLRAPDIARVFLMKQIVLALSFVNFGDDRPGWYLASRILMIHPAAFLGGKSFVGRLQLGLNEIRRRMDQGRLEGVPKFAAELGIELGIGLEEGARKSDLTVAKVVNQFNTAWKRHCDHSWREWLPPDLDRLSLRLRGRRRQTKST